MIPPRCRQHFLQRAAYSVRLGLREVRPKELVDLVTNPSYTPGPKAWIEVTDADAKQTTSKVPRYDLPAPLKVTDEDQSRITVDIKLVDRGGGE